MAGECTRHIEVLVPVARSTGSATQCVSPLPEITGKRVGFRIEGSIPIAWHQDLLQRNFEIFMARVAVLLRVQYQPADIVRFERDERDKAGEPQVFDDFCRRIDWAVLGIAG